jgi:hypothetical protein
MALVAVVLLSMEMTSGELRVASCEFVTIMPVLSFKIRVVSVRV